MSEIITHSPIQTRSNTLAKQERMLSFLVAEAITRVTEYATGKEYPRVDLWNTVGAKIDTDFQKTRLPGQQRDEYICDQIKARYSYLDVIYGISSNGRTSIRDDSHEYQEFALRSVERLIESRLFVVKPEVFLRCDICDYVIAPAQSLIKACPRCRSAKLETTEKVALFLPVSSEQKEDIAKAVTVYPTRVGLLELKRHIYTIPPNVQISKQRETGIDLSKFGVDSEFVLDPKISLAMMGMFLREGFGELRLVVQGIDSLGNIAPFLAMIDPRPPKFLVHGTIPPTDSSQITTTNADFYLPFLALMSTSLPKGISADKVASLTKEFSRTRNQIKHFVNQSGKLLPGETEQVDIPFPKQAINEFLNYSPLVGYQQLHEYIYDHLCKEYLSACQANNAKPSSAFLLNLCRMLGLFYGKI